MKGAELFRSISVWHRVSSDNAVLYECLESLETGLFAVSVSTVVYSSAPQPSISIPTASFVEHFAEHDDALAEPDERTKWFVTLKEAIEAHRRDFDSDYFASMIPGYRSTLGYE